MSVVDILKVLFLLAMLLTGGIDVSFEDESEGQQAAVQQDSVAEQVD